MKSCELELDPVIIEVKADAEKSEFQKHIEQTYQNLDDKCEKILEKLKQYKVKK